MPSRDKGWGFILSWVSLKFEILHFELFRITLLLLCPRVKQATIAKVCSVSLLSMTVLDLLCGGSLV